jgi:hypothetical protein
MNPEIELSSVEKNRIRSRNRYKDPVLKEKIKEQARKWYKDNPERCRERERNRQRRPWRQHRLPVHHIYALADPRDCRVRYIGATKDKNRLWNHLTNKKSSPVALWVKQLLTQGIKPLMLKLLVTEKWEEAEQALIAQFQIVYPDLLNVAHNVRRSARARHLASLLP